MRKLALTKLPCSTKCAVPITLWHTKTSLQGGFGGVSPRKFRNWSAQSGSDSERTWADLRHIKNTPAPALTGRWPPWPPPPPGSAPVCNKRHIEEKMLWISRSQNNDQQKMSRDHLNLTEDHQVLRASMFKPYIVDSMWKDHLNISRTISTLAGPSQHWQDHLNISRTISTLAGPSEHWQDHLNIGRTISTLAGPSQH